MQTAKRQWNSLQKCNTEKQKNSLDFMWFKKKIPLQSDILIFLSILHVCFSAPEITIQVDNTTGVTSQSIYVEWKVCFVKNNEKCGEDILSNQGDLRCFRLFVYHRP